jgi:hypothetical protein
MTNRASDSPYHARKPRNGDGSSTSAIRPGTDGPGPFAESTQPGRTSATYLDVVLPSGNGPAQGGLAPSSYRGRHAGSVLRAGMTRLPAGS